MDVYQRAALRVATAMLDPRLPCRPQSAATFLGYPFSYGPRTWNRLPTALPSPELSLASFKRQLKTHSSVPALDSAAAVGVVYRRHIGAVVTVQRVRRRLQMSRLDSTPR